MQTHKSNKDMRESFSFLKCWCEVDIISSLLADCHVWLQWQDSCLYEGLSYICTPKTAVRLEFHHVVIFEAESCPLACYHTLWYGKSWVKYMLWPYHRVAWGKEKKASDMILPILMLNEFGFSKFTYLFFTGIQYLRQAYKLGRQLTDDNING